MKKIHLLCAALLSFAAGLVVSAETLEISPERRGMVILTPKDPGPGIQLAAEELVLHIKAATGYEPRVIHEGAVLDREFVISLGDTELARRHGVTADDLKHNQARVSGTNDFLIINADQIRIFFCCELYTFYKLFLGRRIIFK